MTTQLSLNKYDEFWTIFNRFFQQLSPGHDSFIVDALLNVNSQVICLLFLNDEGPFITYVMQIPNFLDPFAPLIMRLITIGYICKLYSWHYALHNL